MALWTELAQPRARRMFDRALNLPALSLAGPALALLLFGIPLARTGSTSRRAAAVIAALVLGFVGLTAEVAVMMAFQILQGYIYQALGLMVAAFMTGLALGARIGERQNLRRPAPAPQRLVPGLLLLLLAGPAVWVIIKLWSAAADSGALAALGFSLALFGLAAISGALFTVSADIFLQDRSEVGYAAGWINGADHLGAAAGAFLTGTLVIPVFGLKQAFGLCALMSAAALVIVGLAARSNRPWK
jgi:spermidine synthase